MLCLALVWGERLVNGGARWLIGEVDGFVIQHILMECSAEGIFIEVGVFQWVYVNDVVAFGVAGWVLGRVGGLVER